MDAHVYNITN
uniref:Uncharacterized protein n=1 Tax=Lepeophtheirus salmonis TaxID=72036 RepID=A0A0K2TU29_LEPSM